MGAAVSLYQMEPDKPIQPFKLILSHQINAMFSNMNGVIQSCFTLRLQDYLPNQPWIIILNDTTNKYVHCSSGTPYVLQDETDDNPIPNSIYNNNSGFTHDYYSGTTAKPENPSRCLGIPPSAWAYGGPVTKNSTSQSYKSISTQDGWILKSSETSNKGGTMNNTATLLYVGDNKQDKQYMSFLSFNTAGLPDNAEITNIWLKIKIQGFAGGNMFDTNALGDLLMDIQRAILWNECQFGEIRLSKTGKPRCGGHVKFCTVDRLVYSDFDQ